MAGFVGAGAALKQLRQSSDGSWTMVATGAEGDFAIEASHVISSAPMRELAARLPGFATTPFASLSEAAAAHTITCTSPSKSFNLAGLQVANILIADAHLRELQLLLDERQHAAERLARAAAQAREQAGRR